MSRAAWIGELVLGTLRVPVKLFSAGEPPAKTSFNQAHRCTPKTFTRLQTKRWCPTCETEIAPADISRVFEHAPDQYLEIADKDLAGCDVTASTELVIAAVLDHLNPLLIDTTGYLAPAADAAGESFHTLRAALGSRVLVGHLVLQKRRATVMLQVASPAGFVMYHLRAHDHMRVMTSGHDQAPTPTLNPTAVRRAEKLLKTLPRQFDEAQLQDEHGIKVRALVRAKVTAQVGKQLAHALDQRARKGKTSA